MSELKYLTLPQLEDAVLPWNQDPTPIEVIAAAEPADLSKVLNRTIWTYDSANLYSTAGDEKDRDTQEAAQLELRAQQRALEVRRTRNQLGKRAKVATWLTGTVLTVGGIIGAVHAASDHINPEITRHPEAKSDELVKGLVGGMAGLAGLTITAAAANTARNHAARRNARTSLRHYSKGPTSNG